MDTTRYKTDDILGKSLSMKKNELKITQEFNAYHPKDQNKIELGKLQLFEDNKTTRQQDYKQASINHFELIQRNVETAEAQVSKMSNKESLESPQSEVKSHVSCLTSTSILAFEIRLIQFHINNV